MIPMTEIGLAMLYCSLSHWCNPELQTDAFFESQTGLLRVKSSRNFVEGTSEKSEFLVPKKPGGRSKTKKPVEEQSEVASVELTGEEEIVTVKGKENVPSQNSLESFVTIPETQHHEIISQYQEMTIDESFNPKIHSSQLDCQPSTSSRPNFSNLVSRKTSGVNESEIVTNESLKQRAAESVSSVFTPQALSTSARTTRKRKNEDDEVSSASSVKAPKTASLASTSDSELFNFSDFGSTQKRTSQRKQQDDKGTDLSSLSELQANKKHRSNRDDPDDTSSSSVVQNRAPRSRKRPLEIDNDSNDLFNFNIDDQFKKKPKKLVRSADQPDAASSSEVKTVQPRDNSPGQLKSMYQYLDDSDAGIWLSKAMISVKIEDSDVIAKQESDEPDSIAESQDFKTGQLQVLFSVVEKSGGEVNTTSSSMVSKRKQFVKKNNFKPQSQVIAMKKFNVEETHVPLDRF